MAPLELAFHVLHRKMDRAVDCFGRSPAHEMRTERAQLHTQVGFHLTLRWMARQSQAG